MRLLQEKEYERLGGVTTLQADVRFVAATNRDLEADVARGSFRQDLYFRLHGISLTLPPLRERPQEIRGLAAAFVRSACAQMERNTEPELSEEALDALVAYPWPGNIRELRNLMDRAVVLCSGPTILPEHLPSKVASAAASPTRASQGTAADQLRQLQASMTDLERQRIKDALAEAGGNQTVAAEILGISRRTLVSRLGEYDLPRPRKR